VGLPQDPAGASGLFGTSVAVEGDRVLVGAPPTSPIDPTDPGSTFLYERDLGGASDWGLVGRQSSPVPGANTFGWRVALSGPTTATTIYDQGSFAIYRDVSLCSDAAAISHTAGGTVTFSLDAGAAHAEEPYLLLGSASGTSPGFSFGGASLPLVPDAFLRTSFSHANAGPFVRTAGRLDEKGRATARLVVPPQWPLVQAGATLDHAFAVLRPGSSSGLAILPTRTVFVSDTVELQVTP